MLSDFQNSFTGRLICIVINEKSQGSIAKHLSCDELVHYNFIVHFAGERIFKNGEHWRSYG